MKRTSFGTKAVLLLIVTILLTGAVALTCFAADREYPYDNKYGQIIPTDAKLSAPKTSYSFYGDTALLYFMSISEGAENACYAIEFYADKNYTDMVNSYSNYFDSQPNKALEIKWNLKNNPSGTYYGKCYVYIERSDGKVIDSDSVRTFKIKIDRLSKETVPLKTIGNSAKGVKITWGTLRTATKYAVYRKEAGDKSWTRIAVLGKGSTAYTDTSAKSGKTYIYTVRCFDGDYKSLYNKTGLKTTYLSTPQLSKVGISGSAGYAKISWNKVSGAKGYIVYRKGGSLSDATWKKVATIKNGKTVSFVDKSATSSDWYYTYTVRAFNGSYKSSYNADGVDYNNIKAPTLKATASVDGGVKITWSNSNTSVVKYYVYRKTSTGWQKIGTTTANTFVDKAAKSGKSYIYTVKGVAKTNAGAHNPTGIKATYLATPDLGTVTFDAKNRAKLTWSKVAGAKGYRIYRKAGTETSWTRIADIKSGSTVSYLDTVKKTSGTAYTYTVRAFNGSNFSYYKTKGISNIFLSAPNFALKNKTSEEAPVGVNITWTAVKGAKAYHVYRRPDAKSSWTRIAKNVTELSYYDTAAASATAYQYTVKAINGTAASRYTAKDFVALQRPFVTDAVLTEEGIQLTWNEVAGADSYYVYRRTADTKWELVGSYALNTFTDTADKAKVTPFFYTIVAEASGFRSDYDTVGVRNFVQAESLTATFTEAGEDTAPFITVAWAYDGTCDYIELFKSTAGEENVSLGIFNAADGITEYIDYNLEIGTEYIYTAKAVKEGKVSTEKTAAAKYPHAPLEAVEFEVTPVYDENGSYIEIRFAPVEFAEKYEIYKHTKTNTEWVKIAEIKAEEITEDAALYTDKDVDNEVGYYYTVKAIASDRDSIFNESGISALIPEPLAPVTGLKATQTETADGIVGAQITWDAVDKAQYYKILRKTADGEWEELYMNLDDGTYTYIDTTVEQGVEYIYTVIAYAAGRESKVNEYGIEFFWPLDEPEAPEGDGEVTPPDAPEGGTTTPDAPEGDGEVTPPDAPEGDGEATNPEITE